jgi:CRP-like cAMP-binding protein
MYEPLLRHLDKYIRLDQAEKDLFISLLKYAKLRKKQFLVKEGEISRFEAFVLSGCLRTYEMDDQGTEHVIFFSIENWWAGDLYSFVTETPSRYFIDCLEDSELLLLDRASEELLFEKAPKFERYFRLLFQNAFIATQRRLIASHSKMAEERYRDFLERYPGLEKRIPQHQIASYLGITPESLSRIRKQLSERG